MYGEKGKDGVGNEKKKDLQRGDNEEKNKINEVRVLAEAGREGITKEGS